MKKALLINVIILSSLVFPQVAFAQTASGNVNQIVNFLKSIVGVLVTVSSIVAVIFFAIGGFTYITSTGNPEALEKSKKTIIYAGVGLVIILGAYVLSGIVTQLASSAGLTGQ